MNCPGDGTSVEAGDTLRRVEAAEDLQGVSEHASARSLVLDNDSADFEGVWQDDASQSIAQGDQGVVVSKQWRNQASSDQEVSTNWRNQPKGEHARHTNLWEDLSVGLGLAIVVRLLVNLKNVEGVCNHTQNETSSRANCDIIREGSCNWGSQKANKETSIEALFQSALLIESKELSRNALSAFFGKRSLENSVSLDDVKRISEQWKSHILYY